MNKDTKFAIGFAAVGVVCIVIGIVPKKIAEHAKAKKEHDEDIAAIRQFIVDCIREANK